MPTYEYECSNPRCNYQFEEVQLMAAPKLKKCPMCGVESLDRLIGRGEYVFAASVPLYDFVDHKTTAQPVRIQSKRQWHEHLKRVGQIEAPNTPPTPAQLASAERTKKMVAKKETRAAIVEAVKDKRHINEVKQKYSKFIKKGA